MSLSKKAKPKLPHDYQMKIVRRLIRRGGDDSLYELLKIQPLLPYTANYILDFVPEIVERLNPIMLHVLVADETSLKKVLFLMNSHSNLRVKGMQLLVCSAARICPEYTARNFNLFSPFLNWQSLALVLPFIEIPMNDQNVVRTLRKLETPHKLCLFEQSVMHLPREEDILPKNKAIYQKVRLAYPNVPMRSLEFLKRT